MVWAIDSDGNEIFLDDDEKLAEFRGALTVFGIEVTSRYHKVGELLGILRFLLKTKYSEHKAALRLMASVFYDSKGCAATITLHKDRSPKTRRDFDRLAKELSDIYMNTANTTLYVQCGDFSMEFYPLEPDELD